MDRTTLKQWFSKGKKPLASHFAAWIDSFWHKDEKIPISSVENLSSELLDKMSENGVRELLSGKANKEHVHTKNEISDFAHSHKLEDIEDYVEPNIFDTIESMPPRYSWFNTDIVPDSITFHLSNARVYKYYEGADEEQLLCYLENQAVSIESGRTGIKIDVSEILSTGRFILKFHLSRYDFAKYIERVIFRHKYQVPDIKGDFVAREQYYSNYDDIEGDSILYVKRNYNAVKRLFGPVSGEDGIFSDEGTLYCKGLDYGSAVAYVIDGEHREYAMTGYVYSTPYFMQSSQDTDLRYWRCLTEPIFGLFPFCVLQSAYIDNNNDFCMVFVKHRDADVSNLPLFPIVPDVTFDLILDKKEVERKMQEENIL